MKKTIITTSILFCSLLIKLSAQDTLSFDLDTSKKTMPFHLSYIYPLSTNGLQAYKIQNNVSINILVGVSAGVGSFEGAGFGNLTDGNVNGAQLAGFFNANKGNVRGAQAAGFFNAVDGAFKGGQFAGFANINTGVFTGAQFGGFTNITSSNMKGAQFSGFTNVVVGNLKGFQGSGYVNVVTDTLIGTQISGFVNYAKHVKGFQLGFININDTISGGLPIGFFSYSRTGYHKLEIEGSNLPFASVNFKTGVEKFYNIFTVGAGTSSKEFVATVGYGIGTLFPLSNKIDMNIDLTSTQFYKEDVDVDKINVINKLKINVAYTIAEKVQIYGGPSIDVLVHDKSLNSELSGSFKEWDSPSTLTQLSIGFNAGIRF